MSNDGVLAAHSDWNTAHSSSVLLILWFSHTVYSCLHIHGLNPSTHSWLALNNINSWNTCRATLFWVVPFRSECAQALGNMYASLSVVLKWHFPSSCRQVVPVYWVSEHCRIWQHSCSRDKPCYTIVIMTFLALLKTACLHTFWGWFKVQWYVNIQTVQNSYAEHI